MSDHPFVSIVVPVRNERASIERCLAGLLAQDYPADRFEVVVVDGESDDGTPGVVAAQAATDPRLRLLVNPRRHQAVAMNIGIAAARGEVIARVDGHAVVPPHFVSRCVTALREHPSADCVSGTLVTVGRTQTGRAIAAAMSSPAGVGSARFRTGADGPCWVDTVAFPVFRRAALERVGLFDEEFVRDEDDELSLRLVRAGGRILLLPDLFIVYFCRSTLARLWEQYFVYGFWKVRVMAKHRRAASWRHVVPGALVATLAVLGVTAVVVPRTTPVLATVVATYALAIAIASAALAVRRGLALWPRIAAALVTLHLAYGAGFWKGLVVFGLRGRPARAMEWSGAAR